MFIKIQERKNIRIVQQLNLQDFKERIKDSEMFRSIFQAILFYGFHELALQGLYEKSVLYKKKCWKWKSMHRVVAIDNGLRKYEIVGFFRIIHLKREIHISSKAEWYRR